MMTTADKLEYVIEKIPFLASSLFIRYEGLQIPEHEMVKLADLVIESYAMTCALSRYWTDYNGCDILKKKVKETRNKDFLMFKGKGKK